MIQSSFEDVYEKAQELKPQFLYKFGIFGIRHLDYSLPEWPSCHVIHVMSHNELDLWVRTLIEKCADPIQVIFSW